MLLAEELLLLLLDDEDGTGVVDGSPRPTARPGGRAAARPRGRWRRRGARRRSSPPPVGDPSEPALAAAWRTRSPSEPRPAKHWVGEAAGQAQADQGHRSPQRAGRARRARRRGGTSGSACSRRRASRSSIPAPSRSCARVCGDVLVDGAEPDAPDRGAARAAGPARPRQAARRARSSARPARGAREGGSGARPGRRRRPGRGSGAVMAAVLAGVSAAIGRRRRGSDGYRRCP